MQSVSLTWSYSSPYRQTPQALLSMKCLNHFKSYGFDWIWNTYWIWNAYWIFCAQDKFHIYSIKLEQMGFAPKNKKMWKLRGFSSQSAGRALGTCLTTHKSYDHPELK